MSDKLLEYIKILNELPEKCGKEYKVKCLCGGELKARRTIYDGHIHAKCYVCGFTYNE